jgi:hypothetical protein
MGMRSYSDCLAQDLHSLKISTTGVLSAIIRLRRYRSRRPGDPKEKVAQRSGSYAISVDEDQGTLAED